MRAPARVLIVFIALGVSAASARASRSDHYAEWGKGPVQFLMTRDESSAWRKLQTDDEAQKFIDLFWARRDPTPGTQRNEYHERFDALVRFADEHFSEPPKPGSMTERGRVYVVMGEPSNLLDLNQTPTGAIAGGNFLGGGATQQGSFARQQWLYEKDAAKRLGVYPRTATVYFIEDGSSKHIWRMDVQKIAAWSDAFANAMKLQIAQPDLKEAPVFEEEPTKVSVPTIEKKTVVMTTTILPDEPVIRDSLKGVTTLLLTRGNPAVGSPAAPFTPAMFTPEATAGSVALTPKDDLAWAFEIRNPGEDASQQPLIEVALTVSGTVGGQPVRMTAPAEAVPADPMKKAPGHYTVRGSIPLAEFAPGSYDLSLHIKDTIRSESYTLERPFTVK
jgi:GWxTD domain-containing protein